ncbi:MAG: polysaccharide biosynthesis protein [Acidobacteria bacterium]|nr:MAG: polysaccharide biosynthesis protein [Acidobacteriota bacterium]
MKPDRGDTRGHRNGAARAMTGAVAWLRFSPLRYVLVIATDAAIPVFALWFAMFLRFEGRIAVEYGRILPELIVLLVCGRVLANLLLRLHRWSFRLSGLPDGARVGVAGLLGTGVFLLSIFLLGLAHPPRSVVVMELFFSTFLMAAMRFAPRLTWMYVSERARAGQGGAQRTVIIGAGVAGELLLRDLQQSDEHSYYVVGFVDDNRMKQGVIVGGKTVLGTVAELPGVARRYRVATVLIAIPRMSAARIREILALCANLKLQFKILPVSFAYLNDRAAATMLQDLEPEDLLPRGPVEFSDSGQRACIMGRKVLVTGAAGSIGREICVQLLRAGVSRLVMVDLNENEMYLASRELQRLYPDVTFMTEVADIRDAGRMEALFAKYRPQDVFHAAAHKHVPLMEIAPGEAIKNNVLGTRNVALAADRAGVDRFVFISTDKAVRPTSVMGASKRVAEMIVRQLARTSHTRFCAVRFGNVLGSAGSVVPLFRAQIAAGGPVTVTDPEVKRYFMTIREAVGLVLQAGYSDYGEMCVLDMGEQIKIVDLARHMITMAGHVPDVDITIEFSGLRPGEKLYEELLTEEEERTQQVDRKLFVARCPAPPEDLDLRVRELADAAAAEDGERVRAGLRALVSSYTCPAPCTRPDATVAADGGLEAKVPLM